MTEINPGDPLPPFDMPRDGGGRVTNADYAGKSLVLFFYPRDDTKGCTTEAKGFTEHHAAFQDAGAEILGVSKDPVEKHDKFVAKHALGIPLGSDETGDFCERMGVWVEKSMYGTTYLGIERTTFLIGPDGTVKEVWRKVKVPGHVEAVLKAVTSS